MKFILIKEFSTDVSRASIFCFMFQENARPQSSGWYLSSRKVQMKDIPVPSVLLTWYHKIFSFSPDWKYAKQVKDMPTMTNWNGVSQHDWKIWAASWNILLTTDIQIVFLVLLDLVLLPAIIYNCCREQRRFLSSAFWKCGQSCGQVKMSLSIDFPRDLQGFWIVATS